MSTVNDNFTKIVEVSKGDLLYWQEEVDNSITLPIKRSGYEKKKIQVLRIFGRVEQQNTFCEHG